MGLGWLIGTFAVAGVYGWMMYTLGKDDGYEIGLAKGIELTIEERSRIIKTNYEAGFQEGKRRGTS